MKGRRIIPAAIAAALAAAGAGAAGQASAAETLREALAESKPLIDWRVRYEGVDQADIADTADALTSRLRLGVRTGRLGGTSLLAEGVWIADLIDDYNSTTNGNTDYPVVADPADFARINRFAVTNQSLENVTLTFGRQRIIHGNARFVGNVGWRQHEQTFDAARAELRFGESSLDMAYANQINRVFGPDSPAGKWEGDILLVRAAHAFEWGELSAFGYLLELSDAPAMSSDTYGLALTGSWPLNERLSGRYAAAYARQTARKPNPSDLTENYTLIQAGLGFGNTTIDIGRETLGGDGQSAFSTPLATLHAFQGWADKFLATPPAGIRDTFVSVGYGFGARGPFERLSLVAAFHDFDSDAGSASYGNELDFSLVARLARMTYTLKYARYSADALLTDTTKLWLSMDFAF
jgi:hypothetical protein